MNVSSRPADTSAAGYARHEEHHKVIEVLSVQEDEVYGDNVYATVSEDARRATGACTLDGEEDGPTGAGLARASRG